jgi:hypothetical protein
LTYKEETEKKKKMGLCFGSITGSIPHPSFGGSPFGGSSPFGGFGDTVFQIQSGKSQD